MTILGQHTALETNQLIAATQSQVDDIQTAYDGHSSAWRSQDASAQDQWSQDWQSWKDNWILTVAEVMGIQGLTQGAELSLGAMNPFILVLGTAAAISANLEPDEGNYQRVINAIYWPNPNIDTVDPKNLTGLDERLTQGIGLFARATAPVENAQDFDLAFINSQPALFANAAVNDAAAVANFLDVGNKTPTKPINPFNIIFGVIAAVGLTIAGLVGFNVVEASTIKKVYKKING